VPPCLTRKNIKIPLFNILYLLPAVALIAKILITTVNLYFYKSEIQNESYWAKIKVLEVLLLEAVVYNPLSVS
jgi:hypothetical protein